MTALSLTDAERLILSNQYDILAQLEPSQADDHRRLARNLRDGHAYLYSEALRDLSPVMPTHRVEFVLEALGLFAFLKSSFDDLEDKGTLTAANVAWPGFDGNQEVELLHFTGALSDAARFGDVLNGHAVNSHMPMADVYQRMLAAWAAIGSPRGQMTLEQIQQVLAARRHPDA